jgi:hypothetical protein
MDLVVFRRVLRDIGCLRRGQHLQFIFGCSLGEEDKNSTDRGISKVVEDREVRQRLIVNIDLD